MTGSSSDITLYRDGTGQAQRSPEALDPGFVSLDERGIADWIRFAQAYATQLKFFGLDNADAGTWKTFLGDGTARGNESFIADLIRYMDNPGYFANDPEKMRDLSRPHLALFVSFLQLLGYVKSQVNGFTKRHLDFYYKDLLGLTKKKPVPDVVNVVVELADDVQGFFFQKGTGLYAGKDSLGKDLVYKTEKDAVVNRATVQLINALYTGKNTRTLQQVRENSRMADGGLLEIWQLAVGDPDKGYKLPPYKELSTEADTAMLTGLLYRDIDNDTDSTHALAYISGLLMLLKEEFKSIVRIFKSGTAVQWEEIIDLLQRAYRRKLLKQIREKEQDAATGFLNMFNFAFGEPVPGGPLPLYNGNTVDITALNQDLLHGDAATQSAARNYIKNGLFLTEAGFRNAVQTRDNLAADSSKWIIVYADIEDAQLKKRGGQVPEPLLESWENPVATRDARKKAAARGEHHQFNTFSKPGATDTGDDQPVEIGFAIASPVLLLQEGERTITLTLSFREDNPLSALPAPFQPFSFFLSSSKGWIELKAGSTLNPGSYIAGGSGEDYTVVLNRLPGVDTKGEPVVVETTMKAIFSASDVGNYLVLLSDKSLYLISEFTSAQRVKVIPKGKVHLPREEEGKKIIIGAAGIPAKKYPSAYVHLNAVQLSFQLAETDPAIVAPADADRFSAGQRYPVLKILLMYSPGESQAAYGYSLVKDLQLQKATIEVAASNIKALVLQNDDTVINYKKPFEPFGYRPEAGSHFYFAHRELSSKQLDKIQLHFGWMNAPGNFNLYYANYDKIRTGDPDAKAEMPDNEAFTATLALVEQGSLTEIRRGIKEVEIKPFSADDHNQVVYFDAPGNARVSSLYERAAEDPDEEAINWKRYFRLELKPHDFQHALYPVLLTKQMLIKAETPVAKDSKEETPVDKDLKAKTPVDKDLKGETPVDKDSKAKTPGGLGLKDIPLLDPPYTPKLASFTVDYTASSRIDIGSGATGPGNSLYHITAFGYKKLDIANPPNSPVYLLPYFGNAGELYLGINDLPVPQNLSLLFKMADGSANPDLAPPKVNWHYLSNNEWKELVQTHIVSDTTNGLLNTGIIELAVPQDATSGDTLFQEDLYWLRASVTGNADAIPDTVDVFAQGISAVFTDQDNAADHFLYLLPPESIKEPVVKISEVKKITQPFSSSKGKPAETEAQFYTRVSERLRHKGRALTIWDYEHLILEQFPDIYKVKCVPAGTPGGVDIIVIPNIRGKFPFNPFEPKLPVDGINSIKRFIEQRVPAWAAVTVKNASYVQVKTRFAVKIKEGYNENFFLAKLQEELIRYLAPWAYDEGADIFLNGRIDADMIVNFAAERPYVDYVAAIKLFRLDEGGQQEMVSPINNENFVQARNANEVLVSATSHQIDSIREERSKEVYTGIGYMRIELDFKVGYEEKDIQGIGYMRIGEDFSVA
ncbi:MAG: baseplate J/gp47 family protein [Williamsia sp.]|nr:baseplate J/gp47 family protein [Williamsia sp.]